MATEKQDTAKGDGGKGIAANGNRWWHLLESAKKFRHHAQYSPEIRDESAAMVEHLRLMQCDPDYRADVLGGLESYLDGKPMRRPTSLRQRQAADFLEYVRASLTYEGDDELRETTKNLLIAATILDPLVMGDKAPRIEDVLDKATNAVRRELDKTGGPNARTRDARVARALLRAADVDANTVRKLYP